MRLGFKAQRDSIVENRRDAIGISMSYWILFSSIPKPRDNVKYDDVTGYRRRFHWKQKEYSFSAKKRIHKEIGIHKSVDNLTRDSKLC